MYYRGANAALLLYDITNASTFDDVRGWLEGKTAPPLSDPSDVPLELKKNCSSELIIYIVGSKADLHNQRQVTSDLARLSLHNWFPPPRPPSPPPPPPPSSSTLSYIRPRFTSFTSIRSAPLSNGAAKSSPPNSAPYLDPPICETSAYTTGVGLLRTKTNGSVSQNRPKAIALSRSHTVGETSRLNQPRYGSHFGKYSAHGNDTGDNSSNSIAEDEDLEDEQEWGLEKGMELFEVSAKDNCGRHDITPRWLCLISVVQVSNLCSTRLSLRSSREGTLLNMRTSSRSGTVFFCRRRAPPHGPPRQKKKKRGKRHAHLEDGVVVRRDIKFLFGPLLRDILCRHTRHSPLDYLFIYHRYCSRPTGVSWPSEFAR